MKIAVVGDFHIPNRAKAIPEKILSAVEECEMIVCTGDLTDENTLNTLINFNKPIKIAQGNMDYIEFPEKELFTVEGKKILLIHGDHVFPRGDKEKLYKMAEENEADILIYGHTHGMEVWEKNEKLFINPGSATGVPSGDGTLEMRMQGTRQSVEPHCVILEIVKGTVNWIEV